MIDQCSIDPEAAVRKMTGSLLKRVVLATATFLALVFISRRPEIDSALKTALEGSFILLVDFAPLNVAHSTSSFSIRDVPSRAESLAPPPPPDQ
ncbi:hypothetical protein R1flu_003575 [Riccia fluitans]|uniref:CASP-like protein n=1 Tax=Riccia fluitans TaxID=41844 RepID=A0ABD1Y9H0_9MARC